MRKSSLLAAAALASAAVVLLAGCSSSGGGTPSESGAADAGRACVILPDSVSSNRWEDLDRKYLQEGLEAAGFEADVQNAQGDKDKYATIADGMLTKGCDVMLLVDYQGAGVTVAAKAKAAGIPVIAYDRPIAGADYYVSFDNEQVGALQGQMIVDGLNENGVDPAKAVVVYIGGDPTDGNAKMFHDGADGVMAAAGIKPAAEPAGVWDGDKSAANFEQALTSLDGKVDAVWAANDTNAAGVITILDKNGLAGKVPVSGQDGEQPALNRVALGTQTVDVWKDSRLLGKAAGEAAIQLCSNPDITKVSGVAPFTTPGGNSLSTVQLQPNPITQDNLKPVLDAGWADKATLCKGVDAAKVKDCA